MAIMTATDRTKWAKMREDHFAKGVNRVSLKTIDTAAFVLVLDDFEYDYEPVITHRSNNNNIYTYHKY